MQVQMKIGPKAGELVDLPYDVARNMVLLDQAEDVNNQMGLATPKSSRIDAASVEGSMPMGEVHTTGAEPQRANIDANSPHNSKKKRK